MKIAFINAPVGTIYGSQESVIYHMAKCLSQNHEVTLITGRSRTRPLLKRIKDAPFNVVTVPFWPRGSGFNSLFFRIYKRLHPWKIECLTLYIGVMLRPSIKRMIKEMDVILTYYRTDIRLFSNLAFKYGVPCVSNLQLAAFNKRFFDEDKSIMYLANSEFSKKSLESKLKIRIEGAVTPGVSMDFFDEEIPTIPKIKSKKSLLFVGDLRVQKGIFELIDIFKSVLEKHEDCMLFIVGSGGEKTRLLEKIKKYDLSDKVILIGEVEYEEMPKYYRSATLLIHPTYEETFGMVVLEAMASGLPVIATDIPALKEASEGKALLLPLDDLSLWVEKIDHLLRNEELRKEMAVSGVNKALEHLWEKKAEHLELFLKKAAKYKGKLSSL